MCVAMLVGTTFACFTNTICICVNKIQTGNMDLLVEHKNAKVTTYETIEDKINLLKDANGTDMK